MFSFSASGDICVPMIIYPYMRFPEKIAKSVNPEWGIGRSPNGWMTSETFYEYIANVFHSHLVKNNITFPVILFLDGHKSHLNYALSILCSELQIELFALYPNATRLLQPCDVSVFRPLKEAWRRAVRQWDEEHPEEVLNKVTFAPVLEKALKSSIKPETLVNGFRACGLCPFNPNAIDYSKCLGSNITTKDHGEIPLLASTVIDYETFAKIVGEERISQFKVLNDQIPNAESDDFFALFKIWKHFNKQSENNNEGDINNTYPIITMNVDQSETNANNVIITEQNAIQSAPPKSTKRINIISNVLVHAPIEKKAEMIEVTVNSSAETSETNDAKVTLPNNKENISTNTIVDPILTNATKKKLSESPQQTSSKIRTIDSSLFGKYLTTPESPKRKGKRNIERIPFAITSKKCQAMFQKKIQLKENEEKQKEERKRKRQEKVNAKKETSTLKGKSQIRKKTKENKVCFVCKNNILLEANVIQCDNCKCYFHEQCIPKKHRQFIVDSDEPDEIFLCHVCYKESESDASMESRFSSVLNEDDAEVDELYNNYLDSAKSNI